MSLPGAAGRWYPRELCRKGQQKSRSRFAWPPALICEGSALTMRLLPLRVWLEAGSLVPYVDINFHTWSPRHVPITCFLSVSADFGARRAESRLEASDERKRVRLHESRTQCDLNDIPYYASMRLLWEHDTRRGMHALRKSQATLPALSLTS